MIDNPVLLEVNNLLKTTHTECIGLEALKRYIREFSFSPVIPFKADCLAFVEDCRPDLAALGFAHHCRHSPLLLVLNLPLMMNSCKAHFNPLQKV